LVYPRRSLQERDTGPPGGRNRNGGEGKTVARRLSRAEWQALAVAVTVYERWRADPGAEAFDNVTVLELS
jgi:hypothetical protein